MKYRLLGRTGLRVSSLCLGTMGFMDGLAWGTSRDESRQVFRAFVDAGGNLIDTANTYGDGQSEDFIGDFACGIRHQLVLTTKYTGKYVSGTSSDANWAGSHRKSLIRAVEQSLARLRTDYIDLLYVHAWDFMTPVDEVVRALDDLVRSGKVLYIGVSNAPAWIVSQANTLADLRGWSPFVALQIEYNLIEREPERDLLPMARALDIGVTAWTPLASGWLTGKYQAPSSNGPRRLDDPVMGRFVSRDGRNAAIAQVVVDIARECGCPPGHVALNWLRHQGTIPIFGARTPEQVKENTDCFEFALEPGQLARLNDVSKISLGYPHSFLANEMVRQFVYGGMLHRIENQRVFA